MNEPTFEKYEISINQKMLIMKGVFHNIECGMKTLKPHTVFGEIEGYHMLANPFLSAVIFELAIKSMWELSHSKIFGRPEIKKYGHKIHKVYPCLNEGLRNVIQYKYELEIIHFRNRLHEILHSYQYKHLTEDERDSILTCPFLSLEECLKENSKIIVKGKYEFQQPLKINVVTGIVPKPLTDNNEVECFRQPSPFLIGIIDYIENELKHSMFERRI